jgi:CheY-like chemotaxis protein
VSAQSKLILCVDDNDFLLDTLQRYLRAKGFRVISCSNGEMALMLLSSGPVDAVVVDYEMPNMNGGELATAIRLRSPLIPIVMFSGSVDLPASTLENVDGFVEKHSGFSSVGRMLESLLSGGDSITPSPYFLN